LTNLPKDHPYRQETLKHISILQINLKLRQNKTNDIKEVIMTLSPAYEKWHEETLAEGGKQTLVSVAKTMLREGLAIDLITKITGFSAIEIEQITVEQEK
jgi:hypothetical protein